MSDLRVQGNAAKQFGSFSDLARHLGIPESAESAALPEPEDYVARYRRLLQSMKKPADFPGLAAHCFMDPQGTQALRIPEAVVAEARVTAQCYIEARWDSHPGVRSFEALRAATLKILEGLGISSTEVTRESEVFTFSNANLAGFPELPPGYGFKGGVARKALGLRLRQNISTLPARDIDVVRFGDGECELDRKIAEQYMLDDLVLGRRGVEVLQSFKGYFNSREVTLNEVVYLDGRVSVSHLGLLHTIGAVVQDTAGHANRNHGRIDERVAPKLLRFASQMEEEGRAVELAPFTISHAGAKLPFHLALQLARAIESGGAVAERYLERCRRAGLLKLIGLVEAGTVADAMARLIRRYPYTEALFLGSA